MVQVYPLKPTKSRLQQVHVWPQLARELFKHSGVTSELG